jgi:hypothetical protein
MRWMTLIAIAALVACGGSDSGTPGTPCNKIPGTWHFTDTRTSSSSTFCNSATGNGSSAVTLTQNTSNSFTWAETSLNGGPSFTITGTGSIDSCAANVSLSLGGTSQQTGYQLTLSGSRSVTFEADHMTGVATVTLTTSPQQSGTPCTATYTTAGTR